MMYLRMNTCRTRLAGVELDETTQETKMIEAIPIEMFRNEISLTWKFEKCNH